MKAICFTFLSLVFSAALSAQTVNYALIKAVITPNDSIGKLAISTAGYSAYPQNEFLFIKDSKVHSRAYFVKGNHEALKKPSYWAFQLRGKKPYSGFIKEFKKGAVIKDGTRLGKPKKEYKTSEGLFLYPFEDSEIKNLYWVYASKVSLLD